jgi:hypothetical protein
VAIAAVVAFFLPDNVAAGVGIIPSAGDEATLSIADGAGERSLNRTLDVSSVPPYEPGRNRRIQTRQGTRAPAVEAGGDDTAMLGRAHLILARTAHDLSRESRGETAAFAVTRAGRLSAPSTAPPESPF